MLWGMPVVPTPSAEQDARPATTTRTRYVVQSVGQEALLCTAAETVWRVQVRDAVSTSGPSFVLRVAAPPDASAPYGIGASLELDPRLLDQE